MSVAVRVTCDVDGCGRHFDFDVRQANELVDLSVATETTFWLELLGGVPSGWRLRVDGGEFRASCSDHAYPACPTCGEPAVAVSIGVLTTIEPGMAPAKQGPSPEGPRVECRLGHWYTLDGRAFRAAAGLHDRREDGLMERDHESTDLAGAARLAEGEEGLVQPASPARVEQRRRAARAATRPLRGLSEEELLALEGAGQLPLSEELAGPLAELADLASREAAEREVTRAIG